MKMILIIGRNKQQGLFSSLNSIDTDHLLYWRQPLPVHKGGGKFSGWHF
jgi:hypothetical protein